MQKGNDFDLNIEKILLGIVYTKKFMILLFFLLGLFRALVIILLIMLLLISFSVFLTSKVHTHDEWECKWYFQFAGSFNEIEYQWHYCTQYERELPNYVEVDFPSNVCLIEDLLTSFRLGSFSTWVRTQWHISCFHSYSLWERVWLLKASRNFSLNYLV